MKKSKLILREIEESLRMSLSPRQPKLILSQYNQNYNPLTCDMNQSQSPALSVSQLGNPREQVVETSPLAEKMHQQDNPRPFLTQPHSPCKGLELNSAALHEKIENDLNNLMERIETRCNELQQTIKSFVKS